MKCVVCVGNLATRVEISGKKKRSNIGGSSYFCGITSARLGNETTIISKLSNTFPEKWIKDIKKEGINIIKQPAWQDSVYAVEYYKDGTKKVTIKSDAGPIIDVPSMDCDVALVGSYFGQIGLKVLQTLKKPENIVALDAQGFIKYRNPDGTVNQVPWLEKEKYLPYTDILKLNANELYYLTGKTTLNSAMELLKLGPKVVTLTMGPTGAYIFYDKKYIKVPVYKTKLVDKSGVGDVYMTAFALRYKETLDIVDAAYFAAAASSFAIEKMGGKGIASKSKVEKRYKTLREIFLA